MKTLLVNLYGAPCSGKSVKMMQLGVTGKLRGMYCEISAEVAKEYVVQRIRITPAIQQALTREQVRRLKCFVGHAEAVVTDAPVLIGLFYARYHKMPPVQQMEEEFGGYDAELRGRVDRAVNVYVWRDHPYDERGRIETEEIDAEIARQMWAFVQEKHAGQPLLQVKSTDGPEEVWERILAAAAS